jgi:hypothetical protein
MERRPGNSLLEYVLPALVFVMGAAFIILVMDVPSQLAEWFAESSNATISGNSMQMRPLAMPVVSAYATGSYGQNNSLGNGSRGPYTYETVRECFGGLCLNMPVADSETAGGLGGGDTHALANVLEELLAQLKRDKTVDPSIIQMVTDLANKGHQMGDEQKALLDSCVAAPPAAGTPKAQCNAAAAAALDAGIKDLKGNDLVQFKNMHQRVMDFIRANPNVLANYPSAEAIINFQSKEIIKTIENLNLDKKQKKSGGFLGIGKKKKTDYFLNNTNELTHQSSDTICENGGNQSECKRSRNQRNSNNNNNSGNNNTNTSNNNSGNAGGG